MADEPRTCLAVRAVLDMMDVPLGTAEWRFFTTADGKTVALTTPVMVALDDPALAKCR